MPERPEFPIRHLLVALLAAALAVLLSACGGGTSAQGPEVDAADGDSYHGTVLDQPYDVPPIALTDTSGAAYSLSDNSGLTLVFFGYTNCPDTCQIVMASLASAMNRLDEADRARVTVVLVTTDPARDDEEQLRSYLDRFEPAFIGLTGELATIKELAASQAISMEKGRKLPTGGYEVDHSTPVLGMREGRTRIIWNAETSPAEFAEDVAALLQNTAGEGS